MRAIALAVIILQILLPQIATAKNIDNSQAKAVRLQSIPPRSKDAMSGSEFAKRTMGMSGAERQQAALAELRNGNVPEFERSLKPLRLSCVDSDGAVIDALIWVAPDYLAIGSNQDFLRIPLTYPSATEIATMFACVLPTKKLVNEIYAQSSVHLKPQPLPPGPQMRSSGYYLKHQQMIEEQRAGFPLGELTSGHKKDIVLTNLLLRRPDRIAIYGWHWSEGRPIQPLSTVHGARYADYSHGVRLVWNTVWINGEPRSIYEALQDPALAPLFSYEGALTKPETLMGFDKTDTHFLSARSTVLQQRNPR